MIIYLLRHGDAVMNSSSDRIRPLSENGVETVKKVAEYLKNKNILINKIFSSPLYRAWQTAEIIAEKLNIGEIIESDNLTPEFNHIHIADEISKLTQSDKIMLVSHQPIIGKLTSYLISRGAVNIEIKKASLVCIETEMPNIQGRGFLKWKIDPPDFVTFSGSIENGVKTEKIF